MKLTFFFQYVGNILSLENFTFFYRCIGNILSLEKNGFWAIAFDFFDIIFEKNREMH